MRQILGYITTILVCINAAQFDLMERERQVDQVQRLCQGHLITDADGVGLTQALRAHFERNNADATTKYSLEALMEFIIREAFLFRNSHPDSIQIIEDLLEIAKTEVDKPKYKLEMTRYVDFINELWGFTNEYAAHTDGILIEIHSYNPGDEIKILSSLRLEGLSMVAISLRKTMSYLPSKLPYRHKCLEAFFNAILILSGSPCRDHNLPRNDYRIDDPQISLLINEAEMIKGSNGMRFSMYYLRTYKREWQILNFFGQIFDCFIELKQYENSLKELKRALDNHQQCICFRRSQIYGFYRESVRQLENGLVRWTNKFWDEISPYRASKRFYQASRRQLRLFCRRRQRRQDTGIMV